LMKLSPGIVSVREKVVEIYCRTVVITGQSKGVVPQNVSLVFIDDSKSVDNLNITLSSKVLS